MLCTPVELGESGDSWTAGILSFEDYVVCTHGTWRKLSIREAEILSSEYYVVCCVRPLNLEKAEILGQRGF